MIGDGFWALGVTVRYGDAGDGDGWDANIAFFDDGFSDDDPGIHGVSTEGVLHTRYRVRGDHTAVLTAVIDTVIADARRLGIVFDVSDISPHVYYWRDGTDAEFPPPEGWRELLDAQASRLGWRALYTRAESRPVTNLPPLGEPDGR